MAHICNIYIPYMENVQGNICDVHGAIYAACVSNIYVPYMTPISCHICQMLQDCMSYRCHIGVIYDTVSI